MSWDIYREPLRRGHCEVHPYVHEEYPCSVCIADKQRGMCGGGFENEHLLSLAQEHIDELEQQRDALAAKVEMLCCGIEACIESDWAVPAEEALEMARDESPNESLARLKAEWQADGAQLTADSIRYEYEGEIHQDRIADHADEVAAEIRRQAKVSQAWHRSIE